MDDAFYDIIRGVNIDTLDEKSMLQLMKNLNTYFPTQQPMPKLTHFQPPEKEESKRWQLLLNELMQSERTKKYATFGEKAMEEELTPKKSE